MTGHPARELQPSDVRFRADLASLDIGSTDDLEPSPKTVGQREALEALELGLRLRRPGYNVFLSGDKGTGRFASVKLLAERLQLACPETPSFSYLFNFEDSDRPTLVSLPQGRGIELRKALDALRDHLGEEIHGVLGSEVVARSRHQLLAKYERENTRLFGTFERRVEEQGFRVVHGQSPSGTLQMTDVFPVVHGEPVPMEQLLAAQDDEGESPPDSKDVTEIQAAHGRLKQELGSLVVRQRRLRTRYTHLIATSEKRLVAEAIGPAFEENRKSFESESEVLATWFDRLLAELLDHLYVFREPEESATPPTGPTAEALLGIIRSNLLNDREDGSPSTCPIVEEVYPTYRNLFGTIESGPDPSMASFEDVRAGSLLQANGGILLLSARDVLAEPRVYENLKRVLRSGLLEIAPFEGAGPLPIGLKPEPIPVDVKVVLVGDEGIYDQLHARDQDFPKTFKIKAEFADTMPRDDETTAAFLAVLKRIQQFESLLPCDHGALELLVEEGVRVAESRKHLTTQFSDMGDLMREADHFARSRGVRMIERRDVREAVDRHHERHGLPERLMHEYLAEGKILVETSGTRVGQINGLAFYDLGDARFATPARISATTATGRTGVVNIEREARLSGSIHDKGILILSGFLAKTFAQDKPLSLHAHLAFEQSYAGVDGDSASVAELLALLSSLSGHALRQDLALTGSLNQLGMVQPVGGVTAKIEGFYQACLLQGLTGDQGVLIPGSNVTDLQLREDVVEAIAAGRFHVYAVTDYRQALELLTGRPAEETLVACNATLARYAEIVRDYS